MTVLSFILLESYCYKLTYLKYNRSRNSLLLIINKGKMFSEEAKSLNEGLSVKW